MKTQCVRIALNSNLHIHTRARMIASIKMRFHRNAKIAILSSNVLSVIITHYVATELAHDAEGMRGRPACECYTSRCGFKKGLKLYDGKLKKGMRKREVGSAEAIEYIKTKNRLNRKVKLTKTHTKSNTTRQK